MSSIFKVEPKTPKVVKNKNKLYVCSDCRKKVQNFVKLNRKNPFGDFECAACSKYENYSNVTQADYASFILILLKDGIGNELSSLLRLTRSSDVQEKADGAVKISRAITNKYDAVYASIYTNKTDNNKNLTTDELLQSEFSNVYRAIKQIKQLDNFECATEKSQVDDFIDVDIYVYHINAPKPV